MELAGVRSALDKALEQVPVPSAAPARIAAERIGTSMACSATWARQRGVSARGGGPDRGAFAVLCCADSGYYTVPVVGSYRVGSG